MSLLLIGAGFLVALTVLNIFLTIMLIGKPRQPFTPGVAILTMIFGFIQIAVVVGLVRAAGLA